MRLSRQAGFFRDAEHEIQVLNRYAGGAFAEVIEPGHQQDVAGLMGQHAQGYYIGIIICLRIEAGFVCFARVR